jgi:dihydropyrimidinase
MAGDRDLLIRGGLVVTPAGPRAADVSIVGGRIDAVAEGLDPAGAAVLDAGGCHVLPGVIDAHVHLGVTIGTETSADDCAAGTLAAACGGVTTVGDFTVQDPCEGLVASIERRMRQATGAACDFFLHANVTTATPAVLAEMPAAVRSGVASFKTFLAYPGMMIDTGTLSAVVAAAAAAGGLVMVHAEDQAAVDRATRALVAAGRTAARHFFDSRPAAAEATAVEAVGRVAASSGAWIYVVHLSSAAGLEAARAARAAGARLLLETCPQYLFMTSGPATPLHAERLVCAPPVRRAADAEALLAALAGGEIDVLATDHCPFTTAQKGGGRDDFRKVPGGLPGVETLLPLAYDAVLRGALPLQRLAEASAATPARLFGLAHRKGAIAEGLDGDVVLLDPDGTTTIEARRLHSRTDYTPYEGRRLKGSLRAVVLRGRVVARAAEGGGVEPVGGPTGEYVRARR